MCVQVLHSGNWGPKTCVKGRRNVTALHGGEKRASLRDVIGVTVLHLVKVCLVMVKSF